MSVTQALNHIQSWLNANEYDKVVQGCQEILQLEPGNQRALALMRQAEEKRHADQMPASQPVQPQEDPLAHLQVEEEEPKPAESSSTDPFAHNDFPDLEEPNFHGQDFHAHEKRTLFLAMLIPAVLVVLIGGGIIWFLGKSNTDTADQTDQTPVVDEQSNYIADNEARVEVLTTLEKVMDEYYAKHSSYPTADEIESVIEDSSYFDSAPSDPLTGKFDKAGKSFGYTYAVYDTIAGENTAYIVSALFEDSRGFAYAWSRGASTKNYDDYRDTSKDNVTYIGEQEDSTTSTSSSSGSEEAGPKRNAE